MWSKIISYFTFLWSSTNAHGVHSPFVYQFVTQCLYQKTNDNFQQSYRKIKAQLLKDNTQIEVLDFGKGSRIFKSNLRTVSKIAKVAGISDKKAFLLHRIIAYFQPKNILELGTSLGLGTAAMSLYNPDSHIVTIEGCPNTAAVAKTLFHKNQLKNIDQLIAEFDAILHQLTSANKFELIYIDGNHQKEATLRYFDVCLNGINENSIVIFDDINWSSEMQEAWAYIKSNNKVTVTIDLYHWGLVFFRQQQATEHFKIKM